MKEETQRGSEMYAPMPGPWVGCGDLVIIIKELKEDG
jgi:hypothetical protein